MDGKDKMYIINAVNEYCRHQSDVLNASLKGIEVLKRLKYIEDNEVVL